jgi:hypothetical protein
MASGVAPNALQITNFIFQIADQYTFGGSPGLRFTAGNVLRSAAYAGQ